MPSFIPEDLDISPSEFVQACSKMERERLIEYLSKNGFIELCDQTPPARISAPESIFEESLSVLHGKWNMLSSEEEEIIMKIASRFK